MSQSGNNIRPSYWDLNREFYSNTNDSTDLGRNQSQRRLGPVNFENILQEILVLISDGASSSENATAPMFFLGNPGDYAWGREGLDSIVTQLLNQMDNAG